jgi:ATP-dependent helicase HrpA
VKQQPGSPPRPAQPIPPITYPESLPVSTRREEIARAIAAHQVVIVCGETGSGKTTQLPKIVLELGRGLGAGGQGLIGHTQPRRIAASSVAKRIAQELNSPLGEVVGFKVRFQDRLQPGASVKLMTDGILLAETQTDPLLRAYDTLIIDEAHERSLNIDFLLGHLRQVLPRRPDLKVIVTSATIDADRFAQHFAGPQGPAPVIMVSGRLFPVEQRWRPFEERRDFDLNDAIADAVDELWRGAPGDILVFLPGEREIREASDHLRKHLAQAQAQRGGPPAEILPLFARLSQAEQDRVFEAGNGRRIVLATNVAETSLTVPGIRYVIDTGLARVKRYSYRSKVEQLQVEAISQAAANQRAGRCGRVADGVCIRLYAETEFAGRPRFTDPEILRSSLAGVILRMKSLRLGTVEDFPFLEAPPRKAIADGYALLDELNAVDEDNELTAIGQELARLPLDPRVGRMILEARGREALSEVLVIASALSGQDVRDRPQEQAQAADERHRKFDDEKSEFNGYLKLWKWIEEGRGVRTSPAPPRGGRAQAVQPPAGAAPARQFRQPAQGARVARHPLAAAHRGGRTRLAPEHAAGDLRADPPVAAGRAAGQHRLQERRRGLVPGRAGHQVLAPPGCASEQEARPLAGGSGTGGDHAPVRPRAGRHRAAVVAGHRRPPAEEAAAGAALGEEGGRGGGAGAGHLVRHRGLQQPARELRPRGPGRGARDLHPRSPGGRRVGNATALSGPQPQADRQVQELEHKARRQDVLVDDELIHAYYDQQLPGDVCSGATWSAGIARRAGASPGCCT